MSPTTPREPEENQHLNRARTEPVPAPLQAPAHSPEQEPAGDLGIVHLGKVPLHLRDGAQGRLDESLRLCGLGEGAADERGKTPKACGGIRDVRIGNDEL